MPASKMASIKAAKTLLLSLVLLPLLTFSLYVDSSKAQEEVPSFPNTFIWSALLDNTYPNQTALRDRLENDNSATLNDKNHAYLHYHISNPGNVSSTRLHVYYLPLDANVSGFFAAGSSLDPIADLAGEGIEELTEVVIANEVDSDYLVAPSNYYCTDLVNDPKCRAYTNGGYYFYYFKTLCPVPDDPDNTFQCGSSWSILKVFPKYDHVGSSSFVSNEIPFGNEANFNWSFEAIEPYTPYTGEGDTYKVKVKKCDQSGGACVSLGKDPEILAGSVKFCKTGSLGCNFSYTDPGRYTFKAELYKGAYPTNIIATTQAQLDVLPEARGITTMVWPSSNSSVLSLYDGDTTTLQWSSKGVSVYLTKNFLAEGSSLLQTIVNNKALASTSGTQTISKDGDIINGFWNYDEPGTYYYKLVGKIGSDIVSEANLRLQVTREISDEDNSTVRFLQDGICANNCYNQLVKTIDYDTSTKLQYQINTANAASASLKQYYNDTQFASEDIAVPSIPFTGPELLIEKADSLSSLKYKAAGDYRYEFEVYDDEDNLLIKSSAKLIVKEASLSALYDSKPTAIILASPEGALLKSVPNGSGGYKDPEFYFDASKSYDLYDNSGNLNNDSEASALTYKWDLGDGTIDDSYASNNLTKQHTYTSVGSYTVTLSVKDSEGNLAETSKEIEVSEQNLAPMNISAELLGVTDDIGTKGAINSSNPIEAYVRLAPHFYDFETQHADPNGYDDLKYAFLKFTSVDGEDRAVFALDLNNRLAMIWQGSLWEINALPGLCNNSDDPGTLVENEYVKLLDSTCYSGTGDTLTVDWDLRFIQEDWNEANLKVLMGTADDWNQFAPALAQVHFSNIANLAGIEDASQNSLGGSWADIDNDGDLDLYVTNSTGGNKLYRNDGDDVFTDLTSSYGVSGSSLAEYWQASFADIDNDGDQDLYLSNHNGENTLYINNYPTKSFTDKTSTYNVGNGNLDHSGGTFADYDKDGDLDLFVTSYNAPNSLYSNNYPVASFTEVTGNYSGLKDSGDGPATWADYDLDGDPDLLVISGAPGASNTFWENTSSGSSFTEKAASLGIQNTDGYSLAGSFADYNNDGKLDLFITSYDPEHSNHLYEQLSGSFKDVTNSLGLAANGTIYQTASWVDYDNDSDLDLFVTTYDSAAQNLLYQNNGNTFTDVTVSSGIVGPDQKLSQGQAWGDYDNDGDLDLFIANEAKANRLYKNNQRNGGNGNSYLKLRLIGGRAQSTTASNRDSVGAIIKLILNKEVYWRVAGAQVPFSQDSSELEFGLGTTLATGSDSLEVRWPSGTVQKITDLSELNRTLTLSEVPQVEFTPLSAAFGAHDSQAIAVGDLNADNLVDIAIANRGSFGEQSYLYLNNGDNKFKELPVFGKGLAGAINIADLDNDGDQDLVLGQNGTDYIYRNEGNTLFTEIELPDSRGDTFSIIPFDANGDERLDLAALNADGSGNHLYLNQKDSLEDYGLQSNIFGKSQASSACVADYDNDGDSDLALAVYGGANTLFTNDGSGKFTERTLFGAAKGFHTSCGWADYDNDGDLDIAFAGVEGTKLQILENTNGNFSVKYQAAESNDVMGLAWADFNNDAYLDLATAATDGHNLIYLSEGGNSFTPTAWASGQAVSALVVLDLNNDGALDLAAAQPSGNSTIYLNKLVSKNYLKVNLLGLREKDNDFSNKGALGAKLEVRKSSARPLEAYREWSANNGRSNLELHPLHLGLDSAESYELKVTFPSGIVVDKNTNPVLGEIIPSKINPVPGYLSIDEKANVSGF